jgi:flagellar hook-length control protein FliK
METITPCIEKFLEKKQNVNDLISAGSKSEKIILKNKKNGYVDKNGDMDESSFQIYLKENVEKNASTEEEKNNIKTESEAPVDVEYDETSADSIYNISNNIIGNEKSDNLTGTNIRQNVFETNAIWGNQGKYSSDLFGKIEFDEPQQWNGESFPGENTIQNSSANYINVTNETILEIEEDIVKANASNFGSEISKFPSSKEDTVGKVQAPPDEQVSKTDSSFQLTQLNSQNLKKEVENITSRETVQSSYERQLKPDIGKANISGTQNQSEMHNKIKKNEGSSVIQNMKDTGKNDYLLSDQSDNKEGITNTTRVDASIRKENFNDNKAMKNNQELYIFENSNSEKVESNQFISLDNKSFLLKSGDSKAINPQILMDQIVEGGTQVIQKGSGRVKMTLNPPQLGSLDMDIQVKNNKVEVLFIADTPEIQQSLQANADLLKAALNQQGLKVDGYNVLLQGNMDQSSGYYSGENALWRDTGKEAGEEESRKDQSNQSEIVTNVNMENKIEQYRISLFI